MIKILNPCVDGYIYILDFERDTFCISENAVERFCIPDSKYDNATEQFSKFVYAEDLETLTEDIEKVKRGEKNFHNLRYRWLDKCGKAVWINCRGNVLKDADGTPKFLVGCINEIGRKPKADNVSGLLGDVSLKDEILNHQGECLKGFVLRIGIDNFKEINENKGMEYGDMVLRRTAECIQAVTDREQMIYRIVADEFVVLDFEGVYEDGIKLYKRIRERIDLFIEENGYEVFYTISAGILDLSKIPGQSYDNLMKLSEFALSKSKELGKNTCYTYVKGDYQEFLQKKELIRVMRQAVKNNFDGFETYYQPIIDVTLEGNPCTGAEALVRWNNDEMGFVPPADFIPLAEYLGLINPIGDYILEQACTACRGWNAHGHPNYKVNVNLSVIQLLQPDIVDKVRAALEKSGLNPHNLTLEVTESLAINDMKKMREVIDAIKALGVRVALDDFGTGYSSLSHIREIPLDVIKVDQGFVRELAEDSFSQAFVKMIAELAQTLGLQVCVEGIETEEQFRVLDGMNVKMIQGYYFDRPMCQAEFEKKYV